jgi:toxin ParE1/3/4
MRLEITDRAASDIEGIVEFSVAEFGNAVARKYHMQIQQALDRSMDHPYVGRAEPDLRIDVRSISANSHRIFYSVEGEIVVIRRVLHKSMDAASWVG